MNRWRVVLVTREFEWEDISNYRGQMELCSGECGCRVEQRTEMAFWNILTILKKEF
jgi:hypothetical protein